MHAALPAFAIVVAATTLAAVPAPVRSEEVWLQPRPFSPAAGAPVEIGLREGRHFQGDERGFTPDDTAALQLYSKLAVRDLRPQLSPEQETRSLQVTPVYAGTHMVVYDSAPTVTERPAGEFQSWLREREMEQVLAQREQSGTEEEAGRERLRHHAKTLLRVGGRSDGTYGLLTGQRLEIVPSADPLARKPGDTLMFNVLFNSKPLGGIEVQAWHRSTRQTVTIRTRTGPDGRAALVLPWPGIWMIAAAHIVPAETTSGGSGAGDAGDASAVADWDSFRASLSFELPEAGAAR